MMLAVASGNASNAGRAGLAVLLLALVFRGFGIGVPLKPPETSTWLALLSADEQRDNRAEMALDIVREYIAAHSDKLWHGPPADSKDGSGGERPPAAGWIGRDHQLGVALLPEKVREELKRRGYDLDAVLPGWREHGVLVENPRHRPPYKVPVRLGSTASGKPHPVKALLFKTEHLEDPEGWEG